MSTEKIAAFIADQSFQGIPSEAVDIARLSLMDGVGVSLAGSKEPCGRMLIEYVKELGGAQASGVIGAGFKSAPELAALANGTLAHALDFDDHAVTWMGHPTVVLLPTVFALAEQEGLSGKDVLRAYSVGWEVGSKFSSRLAVSFFSSGWHPTATIGTIAATAAAANLLGLDRRQTRIALGLAASSASGLRMNFGSDTKPFHGGKAACSAIMAVQLARKGFTAKEDILEGPIGFCAAFARKEIDLEELATALGSPWDIAQSYSIKPYPSCGLTHRCIDAMLHLVHEHGFGPDEVEEIECFSPPMVRDILIHPQPETGLQGKFSMEFCMAAAVADQEVSLRQFTDEKVRDPRVQRLIPKVDITFQDFPEGESLLNVPQAVRVKLADGREVSEEVHWPKGYFSNPMTWEEVAAKFKDCTDFAKVMSAHRADKTLELLAGIESMDDLGELFRLITETEG